MSWIKNLLLGRKVELREISSETPTQPSRTVKQINIPPTTYIQNASRQNNTFSQAPVQQMMVQPPPYEEAIGQPPPYGPQQQYIPPQHQQGGYPPSGYAWGQYPSPAYNFMQQNFFPSYMYLPSTQQMPQAPQQYYAPSQPPPYSPPLTQPQPYSSVQQPSAKPGKPWVTMPTDPNVQTSSFLQELSEKEKKVEQEQKKILSQWLANPDNLKKENWEAMAPKLKEECADTGLPRGFEGRFLRFFEGLDEPTIKQSQDEAKELSLGLEEVLLDKFTRANLPFSIMTEGQIQSWKERDYRHPFMQVLNTAANLKK